MVSVFRYFAFSLMLAVPLTLGDQSLTDFATRVLGPNLAQQIDFIIEPSTHPNTETDYFQYESISDRLSVKGSSKSALTSGLGWYLKYEANVHISWSGVQNGSLAQGALPKVSAPVFKRRTVPMTYYMNVCTFSYTTVWWDWTRWEQELDWMALNGINVPLALTGQEYIWREIFIKKFDMTRHELDEFFTGPAFLAWHRMGNLRAWAGPLSDAWIDEQHELQKRIIQRARSLGMRTILPAFAGHVPKAAKRIWPNAQISPSSAWNGFEERYTNVYMVQPDSPVFSQIGAAFISELIAQYGTDHLYSADTFNEIAPIFTDKGFLAHTAASTLESMVQADPQAIWVMQAWLFIDQETWTEQNIEAYLSGVPDDKMIVLDLFSEVFPFYNRPNAFYGKPWIYNMLHNFGGNHGLYGRAQIIAKTPLQALEDSKGKMVGIGLTPEGIEQNYVIYELMLEMAWRQEPVDLKQWFRSFQWRRYGGDKINSDAAEAWEILLDTVYQNDDSQWSTTKSIAVLEPSFQYPKRMFMNPVIYYEPKQLLEVWSKLLSCASFFSDQVTYRYDLVDITRQVLSNLLLKIHSEFVKAYNERDLATLVLRGKSFLEVLEDLDIILGSDKHWLLGAWLDEARSASTVEAHENKEHYIFNAKNLITMWGPNAEIEDYASKQWSGLISTYYLPRWRLFIEGVIDASYSFKTFDQDEFLRLSRSASAEWQKASIDDINMKPVGDTVSISDKLHKKYSGLVLNSMPIYRCDYENIIVAEK